MLQSVLLAGLFWATANFMPLAPIGTPTIVAATLPAAKAAVVMAAVPMHAAPKPNLSWDIPLPVPASDTLAPEEQEFIEKINAERTQRGLNALVVDPLLVQTARAHSREMCDRDYFNHHSPTPGLTSPMDRYLATLHNAGGPTPDYLLIGENIYYCSVFNDVYNVDYGHRALMDSPGHRANILEPRFAKVGLGVYRNAAGAFWVTEMFTRDGE